MRRPRVRLTIRRMIGLVAAVAVALFVAREVWDGMPPRFVVDGIPGRIERLRPGMTWSQTEDILGLEAPWYRGGIGGRFHDVGGNGHSSYGNYYVRPPRLVVANASVAGGPPGPVSNYQSTALIHLRFSMGPELTDWRQAPSTKLQHASFTSDGRKIAEMPGSR